LQFSQTLFLPIFTRFRVLSFEIREIAMLSIDFSPWLIFRRAFSGVAPFSIDRCCHVDSATTQRRPSRSAVRRSLVSGCLPSGRDNPSLATFLLAGERAQFRFRNTMASFP